MRKYRCFIIYYLLPIAFIIMNIYISNARYEMISVYYKAMEAAWLNLANLFVFSIIIYIMISLCECTKLDFISLVILLIFLLAHLFDTRFIVFIHEDKTLVILMLLFSLILVVKVFIKYYRKRVRNVIYRVVLKKCSLIYRVGKLK